MINQYMLRRGTKLPDGGVVLGMFNVGENLKNKLVAIDAKDGNLLLYMVVAIDGVTVGIYQFVLLVGVQGGWATMFKNEKAVRETMVAMYTDLCEATYNYSHSIIDSWLVLGDTYIDSFEMLSIVKWEGKQLDLVCSNDESIGVISFGETTEFSEPLQDDPVELDDRWNVLGDDDDPEHTGGSS